MYSSSQELAENKLLLLYIAEKINMPFSNIYFTELVLSNELLNYFSLQQYLDELISSNFMKDIDHNNKKMITITEKGKGILKMFSGRISKEKKTYLDGFLNESLQKIKKEITINADYTIDEHNSFIVELNTYENGSPLIDLKVSVGSKIQAQDLCKKWRNNSSEIYKKIIHFLIE